VRPSPVGIGRFFAATAIIFSPVCVGHYSIFPMLTIYRVKSCILHYSVGKKNELVSDAIYE